MDGRGEGAGELVGGAEDGGDAFDLRVEVGGHVVGRRVVRHVCGCTFEADDVAAEVGPPRTQPSGMAAPEGR